jgi:hypothetical protein
LRRNNATRNTPPIQPGFVNATLSSLNSLDPSPRHALPCMHANVVGFSFANRSRIADVFGACAK